MTAADLAQQNSQAAKQASVRAVTGTANTYEGDWHALFDANSLPVGTFDERLLRYINLKMTASYTVLAEAMQAFATSNGAANWSSLGTFSATTVANRKIVFVIAGQSNSGGSSGEASTGDPSDSRITQISMTGGTVGSRKAAAPGYLEFPLRTQGVDGGPCPGHLAAYDLCQTLTPGSQIIIVPTAIGGTRLVGDVWDYPSGSSYVSTVSGINAALAILPGAEVMIWWGQGEGDAANNITAAAYKTSLTNVIGGWRALSGMPAAAPVLLAGMVPEWIAAPNGTSKDINSTHAQSMPFSINNAAFVAGPTGSNYDVGGVHYTGAGLRTLGTRAGRVLDLIAGLTSAVPTAPTSLTVNNSARTISFAVPTSYANCYVIETRLAGSSGAWYPTVVWPSLYGGPGDTLTFPIPGGGAREVRVKARSIAGDSVASNVVTHTPAAFNVATDWTNGVEYWTSIDATKNYMDTPPTVLATAGQGIAANVGLVNGYQLTQSVSGSRPTWTLDAASGNMAWIFNSAAPSWMQGSNANVTGAVDGTDDGFFFVAVVKTGLASTVAEVIASWNRGGDATIDNMRFNKNIQGGFSTTRQQNNVGASLGEPFYAGHADNSRYLCVGYLYTGTYMYMYINNQLVAEGAMDSTGALTILRVTVGIHQTGTTPTNVTPFGGGIMAIGIGNDVTPGADVIYAVMDYAAEHCIMPAYD